MNREEHNTTILTEFLKQSALAFARRNVVAHVGDIVMSDFGGTGILRKTRIVTVRVMLTVVFKGVYNMDTHVFDDNRHEVEFIMDYAGQRIKKDGTVMGYPGSARCLPSFVMEDGTTWTSQRDEAKRTWFNHYALHWNFEQSYDPKAKAYVC